MNEEENGHSNFYFGVPQNPRSNLPDGAFSTLSGMNALGNNGTNAMYHPPGSNPTSLTDTLNSSSSWTVMEQNSGRNPIWPGGFDSGSVAPTLYALMGSGSNALYRVPGTLEPAGSVYGGGAMPTTAFFNIDQEPHMTTFMENSSGEHMIGKALFGEDHPMYFQAGSLAAAAAREIAGGNTQVNTAPGFTTSSSSSSGSNATFSGLGMSTGMSVEGAVSIGLNSSPIPTSNRVQIRSPMMISAPSSPAGDAGYARPYPYAGAAGNSSLLEEHQAGSHPTWGRSLAGKKTSSSSEHSHDNVELLEMPRVKKLHSSADAATHSMAYSNSMGNSLGNSLGQGFASSSSSEMRSTGSSADVNLRGLEWGDVANHSHQGLTLTMVREPPQEIRTRTPREVRTFSFSLTIDGPVAQWGVAAVEAFMTYSPSFQPQDVDITANLSGARVVPLVPGTQLVKFDDMAILEGSAKHRELEFRLVIVPVTQNGKRLSQFRVYSRCFYAFSHNKLLNRRRLVNLHAISRPFGRVSGGERLHIVGGVFIYSHTLCVHIVLEDKTFLPCTQLECFSDSVLFFVTPPLMPALAQQVQSNNSSVGCTLVVSNDGRNFSHAVPFYYVSDFFVSSLPGYS